MSNFVTSQKLEKTANILIIVVAILLIGFFIQRFFFSGSSKPPMKTPTVGAKLSVPNVDFSKSDKNILLVLQKGCRFCTESADFYKRIISETKKDNVNVTAVLPQNKQEAEEYLNELGLQGIETRQAQLSDLELGGTPTIIMLNNNGEVSQFWVGKLPPEKEKEVFDKLNS